jgi:hypothetical protein
MEGSGCLQPVPASSRTVVLVTGSDPQRKGRSGTGVVGVWGGRGLCSSPRARRCAMLDPLRVLPRNYHEKTWQTSLPFLYVVAGAWLLAPGAGGKAAGTSGAAGLGLGSLAPANSPAFAFGCGGLRQCRVTRPRRAGRSSSPKGCPEHHAKVAHAARSTAPGRGEVLRACERSSPGPHATIERSWRRQGLSQCHSIPIPTPALDGRGGNVAVPGELWRRGS